MRNLMSENEKEFMEQIMNRVFDLVKKSGKKEYPLEMDIGLSRSAIQNWRMSKSKAGTYSLVKIANYFNVSMDYLVGREIVSNKTISNNATIDPLFNRIQQLNELQRAKLEAYLDGLQGTDTSISNAFKQGQRNEANNQSQSVKSKNQLN